MDGMACAPEKLAFSRIGAAGAVAAAAGGTAAALARIAEGSELRVSCGEAPVGAVDQDSAQAEAEDDGDGDQVEAHHPPSPAKPGTTSSWMISSSPFAENGSKYENHSLSNERR